MVDKGRSLDLGQTLLVDKGRSQEGDTDHLKGYINNIIGKPHPLDYLYMQEAVLLVELQPHPLDYLYMQELVLVELQQFVVEYWLSW